MDWLTFFGKPYLELFGGEDRVLAAPCFQAEKVSGGVLLLAAALPDSPEMTELDQALIALEQYLGVDAFASEHYPEVPCRVPCFDLSETVLSEGAKPENDAAPDSLEPRVIRDPKTNEPIAVVVLSKE